MKLSGSTRKPTFRWQALLILLPVMLLTWGGLWSLRQDRRLVEQAARERAGEVLHSLVERWENQPPLSAGDPRLYSLPDTSEPPPLGVLPFRCRWDAEGRLAEPLDYPDPPLPASWLKDLGAKQRTAWEHLQAVAASNDGGEPKKALTAFLALDPPESAPTAARFLVLQARTRNTPEVGPATELLALARSHPNASVASGLPLAAIATGTLLALRETAEQRTLLLDGLRRCVRETPSILTPLLLRRAGEVWREQAPAMREELTQLRRLWDAQDRVRQLARRLTRQAPDPPEAGTVWLDDDGRQWLAVFGPDDAGKAGGTNLPAVPSGRSAWFLSRRALEQVLTRAGRSATASWPAYADLEVVVAGRRLALSGSDSMTGPAATNAPVLAVAEMSFERIAARSTGEELGSEERPLTALARLPAPVPVRLACSLARPELLYARQTQRTWIIGGLILAAAGAALIGLLGACRAFHRQLRLADMKSQFLSSVSHELRAPIASVRLLAESLERGKITEESKRQDYFRLIGQECRRLSGLIENVLDFSRMDQGRKRYEFEPTDLAAVVGETVRLMEPYARERNVTLEFTGPPEGVEIVADGRALQQALVNLLDNAIKHSPAGQPVQVSLSANPAGVCLSITDRGPGIPMADRARIFEPFFRRGAELRRETPGVGIGLGIVRHVVEAHGGKATVADAPDRGACFTLTLPLSRDEP